MPRSLEQWLAYQAQLHPRTIDLGLDRLRQVQSRMGWRQPPVPVITVAGTNGKGSVSAYCASILKAAGLKVGTFTSPHLRDYRERIRIHDRLVSADELVSAFERIESSRGDIVLTFFEFNTLAALLAFEAAGLDAWVLEVGMGGRLDAVNVVDPDVAVVVSIGYDHQEYLGNTLEAIAREKAGIFRTGRPAVLGSREMPAVIDELASSMGVALKRPGIEYSFARTASSWHFRGAHWDLPRLPAPGLAGEIQYANAATAIAALEAIASRLSIPAAAIALGLKDTRLPARFQVIAPSTPGAPTWILDVAHNPAAAQVLAQNLRNHAGAGRTLAVFGILADKDARGVAAHMRDCVDAWWCVSTTGERGRSARELGECLAREVAVPVEWMEDLSAGCEAALAAAGPADRIVVFGSFHTAGPALDWLETHGFLPAALRDYTAAPPATVV